MSALSQMERHCGWATAYQGPLGLFRTLKPSWHQARGNGVTAEQVTSPCWHSKDASEPMGLVAVHANDNEQRKL